MHYKQSRLDIVTVLVLRARSAQPVAIGTASWDKAVSAQTRYSLNHKLEGL